MGVDEMIAHLRCDDTPAQGAFCGLRVALNIGNRNLRVAFHRARSVTPKHRDHGWLQAIVHHRSRSSFVASADATSQTGSRDGKHQVSCWGEARVSWSRPRASKSVRRTLAAVRKGPLGDFQDNCCSLTCAASQRCRSSCPTFSESPGRSPLQPHLVVQSPSRICDTLPCWSITNDRDTAAEE